MSAESTMGSSIAVLNEVPFCILRGITKLNNWGLKLERSKVKEARQAFHVTDNRELHRVYIRLYN